MSKHPTSRPDSPGGQSFTANPTDQARTYQANQNQTINEHHHYMPRGSLKAGVAWSLAGATVLALGVFVGVDLWERHTAVDAAPASDAKASKPSASSTPSAALKPPGVVSSSPSPSRAPTQQEPKAPASNPAPSVSASRPPSNPATSCTGWTDSGVSRVQVKACGRIEGDSLYMNAEWRTTSGHALVDVYIWLEDATGKEVVYPGTSVKNGMASHRMPAWPTPQDRQQWAEYEVRKSLVHGELYQVSVSVREQDGDPPQIFSPAVQGRQLGIVYT
ncbi:hypothetical protein [Streptomyces sp. 142MFCol3.1]|uniref:hypothetical protein n=1 Tax=Streptomyces sp. 142MFCol3.1 TaxID=1172179 RepID=UPI001319DD1A|nr:hypothetical protein [Streptomyces sp. 142MFCol3.1]